MPIVLINTAMPADPIGVTYPHRTIVLITPHMPAKSIWLQNPNSIMLANPPMLAEPIELISPHVTIMFITPHMHIVSTATT